MSDDGWGFEDGDAPEEDHGADGAASTRLSGELADAGGRGEEVEEKIPGEEGPESEARAARAAEILRSEAGAVVPFRATDLEAHALAQPLLPGLTAGEPIELRRGRLYLRFGCWVRGGAHGAVISRDDRTLVSQGILRRASVRRRAQGVDGELFEVGGDAFQRRDGDGLLVVEADREHQFDIFGIRASDTLYLCERALYAYSGSLHWEHGHLPGPEGLAMVCFAGEGVAIVHSEGVSSCPVAEETPAWVARRALVGWLGDVLVCPSAGAAGYMARGQGTLFVASRSQS